MLKMRKRRRGGGREGKETNWRNSIRYLGMLVPWIISTEVSWIVSTCCSTVSIHLSLIWQPAVIFKPHIPFTVSNVLPWLRITHYSFLFLNIFFLPKKILIYANQRILSWKISFLELYCLSSSYINRFKLFRKSKILKLGACLISTYFLKVPLNHIFNMVFYCLILA